MLQDSILVVSLQQSLLTHIMNFVGGTNNTDVTDDLQFKGILPEDFCVFTEEKCEKCDAAEKKLGSDDAFKTKNLNRRWKKLYWKMIEDGFLKRLVNMISTLCPNKKETLISYVQLLINPITGEPTDLKSRIDCVWKLCETVRAFQFTEVKTPLAERLDAIGKEIYEEMRKRHLSGGNFEQELAVRHVQTLEHVCNPECPWCQLHCINFTDEDEIEGEICDNNCATIIEFDVAEEG